MEQWQLTPPVPSDGPHLSLVVDEAVEEALGELGVEPQQETA
jgi:hypothetical protein